MCGRVLTIRNKFKSLLKFGYTFYLVISYQSPWTLGQYFTICKCQNF